MNEEATGALDAVHLSFCLPSVDKTGMRLSFAQPDAVGPLVGKIVTSEFTCHIAQDGMPCDLKAFSQILLVLRPSKAPGLDDLHLLLVEWLDTNHKRFALVVRELQRFPVADPKMDTTPPGVDPKQVAVSELFAERTVEDADSGGDERPAAATYVCAGAARSDGVVVGHIDIEYELA